MVFSAPIVGKSVMLRPVELTDCNGTYLSWMTDRETNRYMETRWTAQSIEAIRRFVTQMRESPHSWLFAIIHGGRHVGNIKVGPVDMRYGCADISYFVGDRNAVGHGVASEAVSLVVRFAFEELRLHRLQAGVFACNGGSCRVLEKNGFVREGVFRERCYLTSESDRVDCYEYAILRKDWLNER